MSASGEQLSEKIFGKLIPELENSQINSVNTQYNSVSRMCLIGDNGRQLKVLSKRKKISRKIWNHLWEMVTLVGEINAAKTAIEVEKLFPELEADKYPLSTTFDFLQELRETIRKGENLRMAA
jgi:hypothetical protein